MIQTSLDTTIVIDERRGGLPDIAHGGYVSGRLAAELPSAGAEIRLKRPVPTGRELRVEHPAPDRAELRDGETLLAVATAAELHLRSPTPPTPDQARAAGVGFPGHDHHAVPGCFVCSPARPTPDGLGVHPGTVEGRRLVADVWIPGEHLVGEDGHVDPAYAWAALDCAQIWGLMTHVPAATPDVVVTATLAARCDRPIRTAAPHVVVGWPIGRDGRSWLAGAAIFGPDGELCVIGHQAAAATGWGVPLGRDFWSAISDR